MTLWLKDTRGSSSASLTIATLSFLVASTVFVLSRFGIAVNPSTGVDCAGFAAPFIGLYGWRRHVDKTHQPNTK